MKKYRTMLNNKGFTLIEIAAVLTIITILLLVVGISTKGMFDNGRVNSAAQSVETLRSASAQYLASGNVTYAGISVATLKTENLLPSNFSGTSSNPYGGNYTVAPDATDNTKVVVTLTAIPGDAGSKLNSFFANKADSINYDVNSKTWTATF